MGQNMIRVRNRHSATVAKITKGGEGYVPDSAALRAMVKGGLLEVLDGDLSGPAPAPEVPMGAKAADEAEKVVGTFVHESTMRRYAAEFDAAQAALREELDKVTAQLAAVTADRNDLAARLEAAEKAVAQAAAGEASGAGEKGEKSGKAKKGDG